MAIDRERETLWGLDSGLEGRVRGTGRGDGAGEPVDPLVEAANAAAAPSGYEDINGVRHVWHKRADVDRMGSYASIPSEGQFERDGKIYVPESEWVKAHPYQDGLANKLWMLPMLGMGGITLAHALGAGAATAGGSGMTTGSITGGGAGPAIAGSEFSLGTPGVTASAAAPAATGTEFSLANSFANGTLGSGTGLQFATGGLANAPYSLASGIGGGLGGAAAMGGETGFLETIMKALTGAGGTAASSLMNALAPGRNTGQDSLIGGILQFLAQKDLADKLAQSGQMGAQMSDPFASQRSQYWGPLFNLLTNPDVSSLPGYAGGLKAVNARSAGLGKMFSGQNAIENINFDADFRVKQAGPLLQASGAGISPGYAGYLASHGASQAAQADMRGLTGLGAAGKGLIDLFKGIV